MSYEDFDRRISAIFERNEARSEEHLALLRQSDDLVSTILKGHLIAEELITAGIAAHCIDVDQFDRANLRFVQRVAMLRALEKIPSAPPLFWDAVLRLNRLRNELAHSLDHSRVPHLSKAFVSALEIYATDKTFPRPLEGKEALVEALHFLLGGLDIVAVWQEGVEEVIRNHLESEESESGDQPTDV